MREQIETVVVTKPSDTNAMKVLDMISLLRCRILTIVVVTLSVLVVVGVYVFSLPRTYKSETIMLPKATSDGFGGNISTLASLAGMKMGNKSEDAIYPEFYPKVTGSTTFLTELLKTEVYCERLGTKTTLFDYFAKQACMVGQLDRKENETCIQQNQSGAHHQAATAYCERFDGCFLL